jgi:RNA polymerase sigma-70 factor, ECF subfamily
VAARQLKPLPIERSQRQSRTPQDFGELAKLHRNLIFSVALGIVRNRQVAEDVTQETFTRAFKAWPQFRGECEPRAWLARVATNVAISQVERNREFPDLIADRADESDLAGQVEQLAMNEALQGAIDRLPPLLRPALLMFEYEKMGYKEVARRLGISPDAVRVRLLRARRHLTEQMTAWR